MKETYYDERSGAAQLKQLCFLQMKFLKSLLPIVGIFAYFLKGKGK